MNPIDDPVVASSEDGAVADGVVADGVVADGVVGDGSVEGSESGLLVVAGEVGWLPAWVSQALQIFGLTGLAVAQPLFALLGENPTFFVAHRARPLDVVLFALAVVLLPALVLIVPVLLVNLVSSSAGRVAAAVVVGVLVSVVVLGAFDVDGVGVWLLCVVAGSVLGAWCYLRFRPARLFVSYLSAAPVLFVGLFLLTSGVQPLVFGDDDPAVLAASNSQAPVVMLLFDELPLGALLRADGSIDGDRFPGFAELAEVSTWYPQATTVATFTFIAVPAILTGRLPDPKRPPVAGQYPRSLFTMLGGSRELHVGERVTSLCPHSLCATQGDPRARASLTRDTAIVGLHQLLPTALAERWLPSVSGSWTNFGEDLEQTALPDDDLELDFKEWRERRAEDGVDVVGFPAFLASLSDRTGLWYQHEMLPHMHYRFLPDGREHQGTPPRSWNIDNWWTDDELATVNAEQRLMLQLEYADTYVTALLDRLREQGMLDDALLVVMADHGTDTKPGRNGRGEVEKGSDAENPTSDAAASIRDAVLPIPLFVKYPGQTTGEVDSCAAQSIDVLPTIADVLGADLPAEWTFDGQSLTGPADESTRVLHWVRGGHVEDVTVPPDAVRVARDFAGLFGPYRSAHDVYAVGPHRDLVGGRVGVVGDAVENASIDVEDAGALTDVDLAADVVPALLTGDVSGLESGSWVALAVGDRIAGIGPVYRDFDGQAVVEIMIDPSLMVDGENDVSFYLVDEQTNTLLPIDAQ